MFIAIIIIILGACASILWSIYYNIIAIQKNYGTVNAYYWAYYWAMSAMERWLLMSKIKYPTYAGSGWFKWDISYWANSEVFSWDFWKLNQWNNSITWNINSKTNRISWTIDTKTIRAISFYQYSDSNNDSYISGTNEWASGIKDNLTFSWYTELSQWWRNTDTSNDIRRNVDFNRFFWLNNTGETLRWLLTTRYSDYNEKDAPLSGNFTFNSWSYNPRLALSGQHVEQ